MSLDFLAVDLIEHFVSSTGVEIMGDVENGERRLQAAGRDAFLTLRSVRSLITGTFR